MLANTQSWAYVGTVAFFTDYVPWTKYTLLVVSSNPMHVLPKVSSTRKDQYGGLVCFLSESVLQGIPVFTK